MLRSAGVAVQAVSANMADRPYILGGLEAAVGDLHMCARYLQYVSEQRIGSRLTDAQERLCRLRYERG